VRREAWEELGIEAEFPPVTGGKPLFVTITQTAPVAGRHTDVSFAQNGSKVNDKTCVTGRMSELAGR
jgi:8-oxo-dGTP pyrophosphatase MutT (NUDIX family)